MSTAAIAIGPEGDWSPSEIELLLKRGFKPVSLGKRILRASTAVAVACGWFSMD
ncbi:MAG: RsmE family RNA methyltransferase [Synergistaceae bacterium]